MRRIGILVVAYSAASTLHRVLDRIPEDFRQRIDGVLVSDDASHNATYLVGLGYQSLNEDLPLTVVRQKKNLGYGGNQQVGYRWAIENGVDIVAMLHADGQYAPEVLTDIVAPSKKAEPRLCSDRGWWSMAPPATMVCRCTNTRAIKSCPRSRRRCWALT